MRKLLILIAVIFSFNINAQSDKEQAEKSFEKFKQYYSLVYNYYMDTVDFNKLINTAILKSLGNLDPHSTYIEPKEAKSETDRLRGNFEGIGISFNVIEDTLNILNVIANGPSEKVGLLAGDKLISINDTLFAGQKRKNDHYISRLKGPKGTKVDVEILRAKQLIDFTITRDVIPLNSIDASFMIDDKIGYIKLNKYSNATPYEIDTSMKNLMNQGMETLILDLQNNGGGVLTSAIAVADEFIKEGKTIVYTKGLHSPKSTYESSPTGNFKQGKVVVLMNQYSASASEITAGAIQDWDRGLIIGRRSYGKGLVQKPFILNDKSHIRLTTAKYYTPSGRCIQKSYEKGNESYYQDVAHRFQQGLLTQKDTFTVADSLKKYTSGGRIVFGGGGITPDIFVPIDTSLNSDYYFKILRKGLMNSFPIKYANNNKVKILKNYPNSDYYINNFVVGNDVLDELFEQAEENGIERSDSSIDKSRVLFKTIIKANIARTLFDIKSYHKIMLDLNTIAKKAIIVSKEDFGKYKVRNQ